MSWRRRGSSAPPRCWSCWPACSGRGCAPGGAPRRDARPLLLAVLAGTVGFLVQNAFGFTVAATGALFAAFAGVLARFGEEEAETQPELPLARCRWSVAALGCGRLPGRPRLHGQLPGAGSGRGGGGGERRGAAGGPGRDGMGAA